MPPPHHNITAEPSTIKPKGDSSFPPAVVEIIVRVTTELLKPCPATQGSAHAPRPPHHNITAEPSPIITYVWHHLRTTRGEQPRLQRTHCMWGQLVSRHSFTLSPTLPEPRQEGVSLMARFRPGMRVESTHVLMAKGALRQSSVGL